MENPTFRILRRPIQVNQPNEKYISPSAPPKTFEEREAYYASVRQRIMGPEPMIKPSDCDEFVELDIFPHNGLCNDDQEKLDDAQTVQPSRREELTTKISSFDAPLTRSSLPPAAVPLMSIPTAAPSLTSMDCDNRVPSYIQPPQHQAANLGSPHCMSFLPTRRHSDMSSLGFPSSNAFGSFATATALLPAAQPRLSPTSTLPQPLAKPLGVQDNILRQCHLLDWQLLYRSFRQPMQQNLLSYDQQSFLSPSIYGTKICSNNREQGMLQGLTFLQPSSR